MNNPEVIKRYAVRQDGTTYAARVIATMSIEAQARAKAGTVPTSSIEAQNERKAIAAAGGVYWIAELSVAEGVKQAR